MAIVVPQGRTDLCADALFRWLHEHFACIAADGADGVEIPLEDARRSALAMFSLTAPALRSFAQHRAEGNLQTISGLDHVPCDTRMRERLDPVAPEALRHAFTLVLRHLQRGTALAPLVLLDGHSLVALAGTAYCSSKTLPCASCLHRAPRNGSIPSVHQLVGAAILQPDFRAVIPLMPAPMVKQDGTPQNDGERTAANRFSPQLRQDHPPLSGIITAEALRAKAPHSEPLHDDGCHYSLGVTEGDQASLVAQGQAAAEAGRVTDDERHDRAAEVVQAFRLVNDLPLNGSSRGVRVNVIEYGERGPEQGQPCSWVTDLRVSTRNGYKRMRGGRARWKIEHETFNPLKNQGDHFEHHYGHGEPNLAVVLAMLRMLAFLVDQTQQLCGALFRAVWAKFGSKRLLWERMRALFDDDRLPAMRELLEALYGGLAQAHPMLLTDSS